MEVAFFGGPSHGTTKMMSQVGPMLAAHVDERYIATTGAPYAFALYDHAGANVYRFRCFESASGQPLEIDFVDGPATGVKPTRTLTLTRLCRVLADGTAHKGDGEIGGLALYELARLEGRDKAWGYKLKEFDFSPDAIQQANESYEEERIAHAVAQWYENPDYGVYSVQPTDEHPQVRVEVGRRKGDVDEKIAPLIKELWKRGLDRIGSCQQRPPSATSPGRAYVGFWRFQHAEVFSKMLEHHGMECELKEKTGTLKRKHPDGTVDGELNYKSGNVLFAPEDLDRAAEALRKTPVIRRGE